MLQINKPIVEKKRRERINSCLDELKDLLLKTASKHEVNITLYHNVRFCRIVFSVSGLTDASRRCFFVLIPLWGLRFATKAEILVGARPAYHVWGGA